MQPIIEIRNLGKEYQLGTAFRTENFREFLLRKARQPWNGLRGRENPHASGKERFWALRHLEFDVPEGECIGVIGRNGAGKSTLLKIISRITDPSEGHVKLRGRFASLLEVGTGFHSELTGRENIFLNGAILGMRRSEILAKFDGIVAFSEVGKFLDTPVKRYSSGMYVRLAFAVAAHLNPEILVVDEVLAVGDIAFQKKCLGKMNEVRQSGRTVLFVSHNMATVENLCQHAVVLEQGQLSFLGTAKEAVQHYLKRQATSAGENKSHIVNLKDSPRRGHGSSPLLDKAEFYGPGGEPLSCLQIGDALKIRIHLHLDNPVESFDVGIGFFSLYGQRVFTAHSRFEPDRPRKAEPGPKVLVCDIPSFTLVPGDYIVGIWADINGVMTDLVEEAARITVVESDYYGTGKAPWNDVMVMKQRWHTETAPDELRVSSGCTASGAGPG